MTRSGLLVVGALAACGGDDAPAWALQHGVVEPADDGLGGFQVWEFYGERWERRQSERDWICSRAQEITGEPLDPEREGCGRCSAVYALVVDELDGDCPEPVASDPSFAGPAWMGVGPVPAEYAADDPYPGTSLGWYGSWDGETWLSLGWAWQERVEEGDPDAEQAWVAGERYVLWPATAWEL